MDVSAAYAAARTRLLELARSLPADEAMTPVPACPGWVVKDVYAHLAGVVDDALNDRLEGVATDPWTARQVAARRDRTLTEICDEWEAAAPLFDAGIEALGDAVDPRLLIDVWTHEQDIRGAVGRPGTRDGTLLEHVVDTLLSLREDWADRGLPPLHMTTSTRDVQFGDGEPVATLRTSDFEFARLVLGRRTPAEVAALDWTGDPAPFVDHLHVFGPAAEPVVE